MITGKIFYLKDKQAFIMHEGMLRMIGKPIDIAKKAKDEGIGLIHIIDLDAQKGSSANFDIYDKLTYGINVEIEGASNEAFIEHLLSVSVRIVIELPTTIDLKRWKAKKRQLVGKISRIEDAGCAEEVYDVIIENFDEKLIAEMKKQKKRIILYEKDLEKIKDKKTVFAVLE